MKDFDFDELDRAVNSVLATKETKTDAAPTDDPQQGVQTIDQPNDNSVPVTAVPAEADGSEADSDALAEVSDHEADENEVRVSVNDTPDESQSVHVTTDAVGTDDVSHSADTDEHDDSSDDAAVEPDHTDEMTVDDASVTPPSDEAGESAAPLDTIPVKRGRFMDMVAPGSVTEDLSKKPLQPRGGMTISPSSDFVAATNASVEDAEAFSQEPNQTDLATPIVESEVEPDITAVTNDDSVQAEQTLAEHMESLEKEETSSEPATETVDETPVAPLTTPASAIPFIPDVPVEKRPLNSLAGDATESDSDTKDETPGSLEEAQISQDETVPSSNAPEALHKEIMAIESTESVGRHDETQSTPAPSADSSAPAIAATNAEPHPMFDTSTLAHAGGDAVHHTSKISWAIVGVSLFIVGAALGVLYFLYGQG